MDRIAIFIDGSNLYHALKKAFGKCSFDYSRLAQSLVNAKPDRKLVRVYYYGAPVNQSDSEAYKSQQRFFDRLKRTPYLEIKLGRLEKRVTKSGSLTYVEKGVDVNLAVDMLQYAVKDTYDVAVIISGDGDFSPAITAVKDVGKHVELGHVSGWPCNELLNVCDDEILIDDAFMRGCWL